MDRPLRLRLESNEPASAVARARLTTKGKGKGKRAARATVARLPRRTAQLGGGAAAKVRWKLSRRKVRAVRRELRRGKVTARFGVRATDPGGNRSRETDRSRIVR